MFSASRSSLIREDACIRSSATYGRSILKTVSRIALGTGGGGSIFSKTQLDLNFPSS